ncbi:hypothetical protein PSP6_510054 [Paraburkholderia tropica]|nr:hypothetical protein PSP6_510054 [Paraburkholderia tropica]
MVCDRGKHDHWNPGSGAQLSTQTETVLSLEHDIKDDKIDWMSFKSGKKGFTVGRNTNLVAVFSEETREQGPNVLFVVNHQNVRHISHFQMLTRTAPDLISAVRQKYFKHDAMFGL